MIAHTLSKLYPAPIVLCQNDLIGTIEQVTNDLTRLMIADISETRAAQATNQTPWSRRLQGEAYTRA
jgi:hypothetical protein